MPTAFISYSWDSEEHKSWVSKLAARLRGEGVDVTFDQWHLALGDSLPEFMERAVRDNDFVLIICTPNYKAKANNRKGGVGYEGNIMTGELFIKSNNRKFIPILRHDNWAEAAPTWLEAKVYLDLTERRLEENFDRLVQSLHGEELEAPPLGKRFDDRLNLNNSNLKLYDCGARIAEVRKDISLKTSEFFELISFDSEKQYCRLENQETECSSNLIERIVALTGVNPDWLKHGTSGKYPSEAMTFWSESELNMLAATNPEQIVITIEKPRLFIGALVRSKNYNWRKYRLNIALDFWTWIDDYHYLPKVYNSFKTADKLFNRRLTGLILSKEEAELLYSNNCHPDSIEGIRNSSWDNWVVDIVDFDKSHLNYEALYGSWLLKARKCLEEAVKR